MTAPSPAGLSPLLDQLDEAPPMTSGVARLVIRDLTAAIRAVLAACDDLAVLAASLHTVPAAESYADAAETVRAALTAALTPGADTADEQEQR